MFNEYSVYQIMKFRQEEIERNSRDAWKHFVQPLEKNAKEIHLKTQTTVLSCCPCTCS